MSWQPHKPHRLASSTEERTNHPEVVALGWWPRLRLRMTCPTVRAQMSWTTSTNSWSCQQRNVHRPSELHILFLWLVTGTQKNKAKSFETFLLTRIDSSGKNSVLSVWQTLLQPASSPFLFGMMEAPEISVARPSFSCCCCCCCLAFLVCMAITAGKACVLSSVAFLMRSLKIGRSVPSKASSSSTSDTATTLVSIWPSKLKSISVNGRLLAFQLLPSVWRFLQSVKSWARQLWKQ